MAKRDYIDLDPNEIPVQFEIDLAQDTFTMAISYNESYDFFTVDLWDSEGFVIVLGEKIVLGRPLFESLVDERLPGPSIVPFDESGNAITITKDNFYRTVFLTIDDLSDDEFNENVEDDNNLIGDTYG
ncbi:phage baseplate plug family protein [Viridibacillus sp. NPDC096237]|uniref:phage baseplate plug family protein n=1 Tax=Viridibacillus sp. NPDC096237 TaxID=3390721 RepID=UPI003D03E905